MTPKSSRSPLSWMAVLVTSGLLLSCGKRGNRSDPLEFAPASERTAVEIPADLVPCDETSGKRAEELKALVSATATNGSLPDSEATSLRRLSSEVLGCVAAQTEFWSLALANQNLERLKAGQQAGVTTQLEILKAEQTSLAAQYCQSTLANVVQQEEWVRKQVEAGLATVTSFAPMLRTRLEIARVCAR